MPSAFRASFTAATCLVSVAAATVRAGEDTFVERFDSSTNERWTLRVSPITRGLALPSGGNKGLAFLARTVREYMTPRSDSATAGWDVGTQPFELSAEVVIDRGSHVNWFHPGVCLALSSAPPEAMGPNDLAIVWAVQMAGITASVRRGGIYELARGPYPGPNTCIAPAEMLSNLVNQRGGKIESATWPEKTADGTPLTLRFRREPNDVIHFEVWNPSLPGKEDRPWYVGDWQMPAEIARVPLKYVVVKRIPVTSVHVGYPSFVMRGRVEQIQGWLLSSAPPPRPTRAEPIAPVLAPGEKVLLHGEEFFSKVVVAVGGKPAGTKVRHANLVEVTLPALPPGRHELVIANLSGLFASLPGGVTYGRRIETVEPLEASPAGGQTVTVRGAGFEASTVVTFNGQPAKIARLVSPSEVQVVVPPGRSGPAAVAARTGEDAFAGEPAFGYAPHPYLFCDAADLPGLRRKFSSPAFADYRAMLLRSADGVAEPSPVAADDLNNPASIIPVLAWSYVLTGEAKYRDRAMQWVRAVWNRAEVTDFQFMTATALAEAYDLLFDDLSPADRAGIQRYLRRSLAAYLKAVRGGDWFLGGGPNRSNTVAVGNCGGAMAALALRNALPADANEAVAAAVRHGRDYIETCLTPDGGCVEGSLYWDYGLSYFLILAHALDHAAGDSHGLLDHPHLMKDLAFPTVTLGGDRQLFTFNDTQPWLSGGAILADLGSRTDSPLGRWLADLVAAELAGKGSGVHVNTRGSYQPFLFLWRDEKPAPKDFPGLPTLAKLNDMQWGVMRSDGEFRPRLVVGVKGQGGPLTHHAQCDAGSFVLQSRGEAMLIDPGYYQGEADAHSLPLIDGVGPANGQKRPGVGIITDAWEAGPWRAMTVDSTEGYAAARARRVQRVIAMHGDDAVIVLDDVLPADGAKGQITYQLQAGFDANALPGGRSAEVRGKAGRLGVTVFGPAIELRARKRDFGRSWVFANLAKEGKVSWHSIEGTYTADAANPMATVLLPAGPDGALPTATVERRDKAITVRLPGKVEAVFEYTEQGWSFRKPK